VFPVRYELHSIHRANVCVSDQIIERDLDLIIGTGHKVILAGDYNAMHVTWRARQNNTARQSLLKHYYKNKYVISAPSQPTHFPNRNPIGADILDFAIVSNVLSNHSIRTLGSLSTSDHNPVLLTIRGPLQADETKPNLISREANWKRFQSYVVVTQCLDGNCSNREVDVAAKHLIDTLNSAARYAIPLRSRSFIWMQIATYTRILIRKRNKLPAQWQRTHDITIRTLINSLKEQIDSA
jgi:hypothetical protein